MDFPHENTPKPDADLSEDEGRSHFLETLGAGDDAMNSLRQLRELTARNREEDGVVLSSQPDDITDTVAGSVAPSRSVEVSIPAVRAELESGKAPMKSAPKAPGIQGRVISIEIEKHPSEPAAQSAETPSAESGSDEGGPESVSEVAVTENEMADPPAPPEEEVAVAEIPDEEVTEAKVEPETEFESDKSDIESEPELEVQPEPGNENADEAGDSPAGESMSVEKEDAAPAALVPADPAPNEQITLACPKCEGELTLMRQHLGVEGNCVWCQLPIVAAASGANGLVRIFPLQVDAAPVEAPAAEVPAKEEAGPVEAEVAKPAEPAEPEVESVSVENEAPQVEETSETDLKPESEEDHEVVLEEKAPEAIEVEIGKAASAEATREEAVSECATEEVAEEVDVEVIPDGFSNGFSDGGADTTSVLDLMDEVDGAFDESDSEPSFISASDRDENEEMPMTIESFQSIHEDVPASFLAPAEDLPELDSMPTGFQSSFSEPAAEEKPQDEMPSGFASPMLAPAPDSSTDSATPLDSRDEQNLAPAELKEDLPAPVGFTGLPAPVKEEAAVPDGFTSAAPAMEGGESPISEAPAEFSDPTVTSESTFESDMASAAFNTPMPWGAPTEPVNKTPAAEEPASEAVAESIPTEFSGPAETGAESSMPSASGPWAALPPMPVKDAEVSPADTESSPGFAQETSGFVERKDEAEAAAISGFLPDSGLDDAPQALPPFPQAGENQGMSGFEVPAAVPGESGFGKPEVSEESSETDLPAPEMDTNSKVDFGSPAGKGFANPESEKEEDGEKGFGVSLLNPTEDTSGKSPFGDSPFSSLLNPEKNEAVEEPAGDVVEGTSAEAKLPPPITESAPVNKVPEPEGPRVESRPLSSISPKKKSRKGFIIFMVILIGFVCGGALATFVLPVEEYVAAARSYMEAKFGVEGGMPSGGIDLPSMINSEAVPEEPAAN